MTTLQRLRSVRDSTPTGSDAWKVLHAACLELELLTNRNERG